MEAESHCPISRSRESMGCGVVIPAGVLSFALSLFVSLLKQKEMLREPVLCKTTRHYRPGSWMSTLKQTAASVKRWQVPFQRNLASSVSASQPANEQASGRCQHDDGLPGRLSEGPTYERAFDAGWSSEVGRVLAQMTRGWVGGQAPAGGCCRCARAQRTAPARRRKLGKGGQRGEFDWPMTAEGRSGGDEVGCRGEGRAVGVETGDSASCSRRDGGELRGRFASALLQREGTEVVKASTVPGRGSRTMPAVAQPRKGAGLEREREPPSRWGHPHPPPTRRVCACVCVCGVARWGAVACAAVGDEPAWCCCARPMDAQTCSRACRVEKAFLESRPASSAGG